MSLELSFVLNGGVSGENVMCIRYASNFELLPRSGDSILLHFLFWRLTQGYPHIADAQLHRATLSTGKPRLPLM